MRSEVEVTSSCFMVRRGAVEVLWLVVARLSRAWYCFAVDGAGPRTGRGLGGGAVWMISCGCGVQRGGELVWGVG